MQTIITCLTFVILTLFRGISPQWQFAMQYCLVHCDCMTQRHVFNKCYFFVVGTFDIEWSACSSWLALDYVSEWSACIPLTFALLGSQMVNMQTISSYISLKVNSLHEQYPLSNNKLNDLQIYHYCIWKCHPMVHMQTVFTCLIRANTLNINSLHAHCYFDVAIYSEPPPKQSTCRPFSLALLGQTYCEYKWSTCTPLLSCPNIMVYMQTIPVGGISPQPADI
jgi:hypothetical protein